MKNIESFFISIENIKSVNEIHKMKDYVQHGKTSTYSHCKQVSYCSYLLAKKLKLDVDYSSLVKGAFLHDFYLYDWHTKNDGHNLHAFTHAKQAAKNASKVFILNSKEINIIESHMWPLTFLSVPKSKEAIIVCLVDKFCSIVEILKKENSVCFDNE